MSWRRYVEPEWPRYAMVVRRFMAAHAFASWTAYEGTGVRSIVSSIQLALAVLRQAEESAGESERELLYRLRKTCEAGLIAAELAAREDELENRILAARVPWEG